MKPGNVWREDGTVEESGVLLDLGSHLVDQALVLFGTPTIVTARIMKQRDVGTTEDAFEVVLECPDGLRAILRSSFLAMNGLN